MVEGSLEAWWQVSGFGYDDRGSWPVCPRRVGGDAVYTEPQRRAIRTANIGTRPPPRKTNILAPAWVRSREALPIPE